MMNLDRATTSPASVLLVDDTPGNLLALNAVLKPLGARLVDAQSGAEALACLSREPFAVVLLDVQMPDMDGFEVARRIRQTENGREVPILFLTAIHRDEQWIRRGYATGAADYITKPFDADVLRARVKAFVDLFQQREEVRRSQVAQRTRERDEAMQRLREVLESERAARAEAEMSARAKDQFLATVSHELRTPLNAILGWVVLARQSPAQLERALTIIERNARAQARIIDDVLDISRIVSGKFRLDLAPTNLADVIQAAVEAVRPAAETRGVALCIAVDDLGQTLGDPERLQQVVWNLLSNGIKFTPKGGRVTLEAFREDSRLVLRVSDTGQGIDTAFLPYLFDAFRQADGSTTRRHGGLGLGLAIAKQMVQAHGGRIEAASAGVGQGATFTVELPIRRVPALSSPEAGPPGEAVADSQVRLSGLRVLVVDDEDDARVLLQRVLEERGAIVSVAAGSQEALSDLEQFRPDVLVSDIAMPDIDGYHLIRSIRALPPERGGRTPAIALTAYARAEDSQRAFSAGFQRHVPKPVDFARLVSLIANLGGIPLC